MDQTQAIFLLSSALLLSCACAAATNFIKYGYTGDIGPDKWGTLPDSRLCSEGKNQSPIDIPKHATVYNKDLKAADRDYSTISAFLINDGHNIQMRFDRIPGNLYMDGKNFSLVNLHWHTPSEHTVDGKRLAMELHLVHVTEDAETAIIGILYHVRNDDAFLLQMKDELAELAKDKCTEDQEAQVTIKNLIQTRSLKRRSRKYFRYVGSLTMPPCSENVHWLILGKVRAVTQTQIDALQAPMGEAYRNNARPTQPLNGRTVQLFDELYDRKQPKN